jgi:hypothetical protein
MIPRNLVAASRGSRAGTTPGPSSRPRAALARPRRTHFETAFAKPGPTERVEVLPEGPDRADPLRSAPGIERPVRKPYARCMTIWTLLGGASVLSLLLGVVVVAVRSVIRENRLERESLERQRVIAEEIRLSKRG